MKEMLSRPDRYTLVPPPRLWPVTSYIYIYISRKGFLRIILCFEWPNAHMSTFLSLGPD